MTVQAVIGGNTWIEFATIKGMGDFVRWVDGLSKKEYPSIVHLSDWGWVNELQGLEEELKNAMVQHPPESELKGVLENLIYALSTADGDAASVLLTDGTSPDENADGEWWIEGRKA